MSKKKKTMLVAAVVLGVTVLGLAAGVYAKYIASIEGKSASVAVAKWAFKEENETATLKCPLNDTYNPDTLVNNRIAPGTSGTCEIEIANAQSEVGVKYTITVAELNAPQNVEFTKDDGTAIAKNGTITGTLKPGESAKKVKINWKWKYYTSDADDGEDTIDGRTAAGKASTGVDKLEATFNISGVQVQPAAQ